MPDKFFVLSRGDLAAEADRLEDQLEQTCAMADDLFNEIFTQRQAYARLIAGIAEIYLTAGDEWGKPCAAAAEYMQKQTAELLDRETAWLTRQLRYKFSYLDIRAGTCYGGLSAGRTVTKIKMGPSPGCREIHQVWDPTTQRVHWKNRAGKTGVCRPDTFAKWVRSTM